MRTEMKLMHQRLKTTTVYVTHDQIEAMTLGDKVAVMKDGIIQQFGTPKQIYNDPANLFVASFIGQGYFIRGQLVDPETVTTELGVLRGNRAYTWPAGSAVDLLLRPDDIVHTPDSSLKARIVGKSFQGAATLYQLQLPTGSQLEAVFPSHLDYLPGAEVGIQVAADHLVLFPAAGSVPVLSEPRRHA